MGGRPHYATRRDAVVTDFVQQIVGTFEAVAASKGIGARVFMTRWSRGSSRDAPPARGNSMPFESRVRPTDNLIVTTGTEPATDVELEGLVRQLTARLDFRPHYDRLVDLGALGPDFFSIRGAHAFVAAAIREADRFLACGKTAIVVSSSAVFGTARIIQTRLTGHPRQIRVFRDLDAATQWLADETLGA